MTVSPTVKVGWLREPDGGGGSEAGGEAAAAGPPVLGLESPPSLLYLHESAEAGAGGDPVRQRRNCPLAVCALSCTSSRRVKTPGLQFSTVCTQHG